MSAGSKIILVLLILVLLFFMVLFGRRMLCALRERRLLLSGRGGCGYLRRAVPHRIRQAVPCAA